MRYRADIDGLRFIAVMPVVLFHVGVPFFSGGFTGVDIFFVISGYLITRTIAEEIRNDRFTVVSFYERRIRRIFPALIVMLAVSIISAAWILFPSELIAFSKSVVATGLFGSNVLFWKESGYFDAAATAKPLLHTWSLAVEEQYYIVFPVFLWLLWRWKIRRLGLWVGLAALISFVASAYFVRAQPESAFYLLPSRGWELFLGALVALDVFPEISNDGLREIAALIGIVLIGCGIFILSERSAFPGFNALYPCVGSALLIHTGEKTHTGRILSLRPFVFIGLISYSLYLWHWPLIVFLHQYGIYVFTPLNIVLVVAASIGLATLSWQYVEKPFRRRDGFNRRQVFAYGIGGMAALTFLGFAVYLSNGFPGRFPPGAIEVAHYADAKDPREERCTHSRNSRKSDQFCIFGATVEPHIAVWGDSHAGAMISAIGEVAEGHGQAVEFIGHSGCPPLIGVIRVDDPSCLPFNDGAIKHLKAEPNIHAVILISRYAVNLYGGTYDFGPAEEARDRTPLVSTPGRGPISPQEAEQLFATQMNSTVKALLDAGKYIVLVYPIPETGYDIPHVAARMIVRGQDPATFQRPAAYFRKRNGFIIRTLDGLGPVNRITRIRPSELFCSEINCAVFKDGAPLYRDDDHPSSFGSAMIAKLLDPIFDNQANWSGAK